MNDYARRMPGPPGQSVSKPGPSTGISRIEYDELRKQVADLESRLIEALSEKNQWNAVLRKWETEGKPVIFALLTGGTVQGKIAWIDRYTIGVTVDNGTTFIIHKGAIATIHR